MQKKKKKNQQACEKLDHWKLTKSSQSMKVGISTRNDVLELFYYGRRY